MSRVEVKLDNVAKILADIKKLTSAKVLVGVPADKSGRKDGGVNNAALAYVHNFGSPAQNIPAREFMAPGIKAAQPQIVKSLGKAATAALERKTGQIPVQLASAGLVAQNAIRGVITADISPELTEQTLKARARRKGLNKGAKAALATGIQAGNVTPLVDTGQLRKSITYVVRDK